MNFTFEAVKTATLTLANERGRQAAVDLLNAYGVRKASSLKQEQWESYCNAAGALIASGHFHPEQIVQGFGCVESHVAPAAAQDEPVRPALDWNKPTSIDRFPGFIVSAGRFNDYEADMCPGAFTGHPLQRLADEKDATHGSAFLKG